MVCLGSRARNLSSEPECALIDRGEVVDLWRRGAGQAVQYTSALVLSMICYHIRYHILMTGALHNPRAIAHALVRLLHSDAARLSD